MAVFVGMILGGFDVVLFKGDDGLKLGGLEKPELIEGALEGAREGALLVSNAEDGITVW